MSLATSCPSCGTVFRVVQDQLKISEGWVRCGNCQEVFNALEGLFDLDRRDPSAPQASGMATPATDDPNDPSWAETRPAMFANVTSRSHADPAAHDPFDQPLANPSPDQGPWLNKPQPPTATAPEPILPAGQPSFPTQPTALATNPPRTGRLHMPAEAGPDSLLSVSEFSEFAQDPDEHPTHYPTTTLEFRSEAFSAFAAARLRQTPSPEPVPTPALTPQPQGIPRPTAAPPLFDASPAAVDVAPVFSAAPPEIPVTPPQAAPTSPNASTGTPSAYLTAAGFLTTPSTPVPAPPYTTPVPPPAATALGTQTLSAQALLDADDDTPVYTPEDDPFEKTQDLSTLQPSRFNSSPESYIPTDITLETAQNGAAAVHEDMASALPASVVPAENTDSTGSGWLKKRRQAAAQSARDAEAERGFSTLESELAYAQHHEGSESILPDFIRQANNQARWQQPHVRAGMAVLAGVLGLTLVGQLAYQSRDTLAARWPQTQPVLEALCAVTGCELEPPRQLDALVVDSTTLTRPPGVDAYVLGVNLHNRAVHMIAAPHIELSLTDAAGNVVVRRVLTPAEFRQGNMLPAQSDASWNLTFSSTDRRISGYTLAAFYP